MAHTKIEILDSLATQRKYLAQEKSEVVGCNSKEQVRKMFSVIATREDNIKKLLIMLNSLDGKPYTIRITKLVKELSHQSVLNLLSEYEPTRTDLNIHMAELRLISYVLQNKIDEILVIMELNSE